MGPRNSFPEQGQSGKGIQRAYGGPVWMTLVDTEISMMVMLIRKSSVCMFIIRTILGYVEVIIYVDW